MSDRPIGIAQAAEDYVRFWETLTPASLERLSEVAAPDIHFTDPFNDVHGLTGLRAVFDDLFQRTSNPRFRVIGYATSGDRCFMRWCLEFGSGRRDWQFDGMSEVRFDPSGRAIEHFDHWDAAGQLYERLPIIGMVLRTIRRRLAA